MVVYGLFDGEEYGHIIFQGDLKECHKYVETLDFSIFHSLTICEDNGEIFERFVDPPRPTW